MLSRGGRIELEHLPPDIRTVATAAAAPGSTDVRPLAVVLKQVEREQILRALAVAQGKRTKAAELLGISRKNLWEKLNAHGISDSDVEE